MPATLNSPVGCSLPVDAISDVQTHSEESTVSLQSCNPDLQKVRLHNSRGMRPGSRRDKSDLSSSSQELRRLPLDKQSSRHSLVRDIAQERSQTPPCFSADKPNHDANAGWRG